MQESCLIFLTNSAKKNYAKKIDLIYKIGLNSIIIAPLSLIILILLEFNKEFASIRNFSCWGYACIGLCIMSLIVNIACFIYLYRERQL